VPCGSLSLPSFATFRSGWLQAKDKRSFRRAIVDPPRKGLHHLLLQNIPKIGIEELYYVSCSPPTLARDLKELHKMGYKTEWCQPFEMFPQTYHIETVTKLTKK
jgi:23S rRNA (uracil1939-C5)-methyltransferase